MKLSTALLATAAALFTVVGGANAAVIDLNFEGDQRDLSVNGLRRDP